MKIELKKIQHRIGTTFIYITHDQGEALVMSNRVAVMDAGRLIQIGTPQELYDQPQDRFVANFIGDHNEIPVTVREKRDGSTISGAGGLNMISASGKSLPVGKECRLYIRPEKIELLDGNDRSFLKNSFLGTVTDSIFEGALIKYSVSISDDVPTLTVSVPNVQQESPYAVGTHVRISWAPENALTL
jgi:ABC-type Fe3+/spermidine/putrescine transport system ATPase subunit